MTHKPFHEVNGATSTLPERLGVAAAIMVGIMFVAAWLSGLPGCQEAPSGGSSTKPLEPEVPKGMLTPDEEQLLRDSVANSVGVTSGGIADRGARQVVVPPVLFQLHATKRVAVLKALLALVESGKPGQAINAITCAVALEEDPAEALGWFHARKETYDEVIENLGRSERELAKEALRRFVARAENQRRDGKGDGQARD